MELNCSDGKNLQRSSNSTSCPLGAHQKFQHMTDCISHCLLSTYRCRCQPSVLFHPHGTELFPNAQTDLPLAALRCSCQVSAEPSIPLLPFLRELQGAVRSSLGLQFPRLGHPNALSLSSWEMSSSPAAGCVASSGSFQGSQHPFCIVVTSFLPG